MKSAFDLFRTTRKRIYDLANDMAWEEVNTIPEGFSNSISWNLAHILVTQQLLHYKLSGLEMLLLKSTEKDPSMSQQCQKKIGKNRWIYWPLWPRNSKMTISQVNLWSFSATLPLMDMSYKT